MRAFARAEVGWMLRVLLAAMVPCFAIGITGLLITTIGGRILLQIPKEDTPPVALAITIGIMVVCAILSATIKRPQSTPPSAHH
jgi:glucose uptake protein GlcU